MRAKETGCSDAVINLALDMYARPRIAQVHGASSRPVEVNRGILAGCGFAVHFLKAIIIGILQESPVDNRDYVDDVALHNATDAIEQGVIDVGEALEAISGALEGIGQQLNRAKECVYIEKAKGRKLRSRT